MAAATTAATPGTATSADGTTIAYERTGDGPPVVLVDGALCYRASGPARPLAAVLAERFTTYVYDRRGRGDSGGAMVGPDAIAREIEDLAAVLEAAGGRAGVYGISSGAMLALEAAAAGAPIDRLALYEAPLIVDGSRPPVDDAYVARMGELVEEDRSGAVRHFLRRGVGLPAPVVAVIRVMPGWSKMTAVAPTLVHDTALTAPFQRGAPLPAERWAGATMPTLAIGGGKSPAWIQQGMRALSEVLPNATHRTLPRQTHLVKPAALGPVLVEFFGAGA